MGRGTVSGHPLIVKDSGKPLVHSLLNHWARVNRKEAVVEGKWPDMAQEGGACSSLLSLLACSDTDLVWFFWTSIF